jgi:hypothetical protein
MSGMKKLLAWLLICPVVFAQVPSLDDTLKQAVSGPQALTQAMEPWLDANGFDRLREALKTAKPKTAAEWHGVALLQQGLMDHEAVLAAFKKACGMKTGVTAEMRLSLSRELARSRQFAEALQTSDALETASLDAATARELFWLLAGISTEGDFRSAGLERIRKLAAARPDDLELQTSLIRLERRHGSSSATEQKVREGFEKATGPQARSAWLLLSLEEHSRQGRLVQLIEMALSHLGEIAAGSDDERQALEQVRQVFQNGREDPKLTTRPQDIAAKYPQRPAIVLAMVEVLRERGETSEAARLLGGLKDNLQAGRLLAEWAEEDDREEALPPVVPAQVTEVKSAVEMLPEATWRVELASLKEAEARSRRLIELRRERPDDEELAMAGIELWTGQQRFAETLHEALRMHHRCAGDEKRLRGWWASLIQGQAGWAIRQQGMHLPWLVNDPAFAIALRMANGRFRPADQMDPALWREVHEALTRGLTRFAARTMLVHADDEALDAEQAGRLAVGLMAARAWKDAAAFLGLQLVRFPKDYRLAFLHGIALEGHGDAAGAEKVFLSLGGFTQEISFETTQQPFSRHGIHIPPGTRDDPWTAISQAVELSTRFSQMLAQWREHAAYSGSESWRVLPPTVKAAGAWGMVQLLEIAAKRDGPGREDLARRAREAGLPLPELLVAGKLASESTDGYSAYTRLELDEAWLLEHVELEWAAQALLRQLQMRMFRGQPLTPEEKAKDAGTAREVAGRVMEKSPRLALQAALQAWQLMPEAAMPPEVPAAVEKAGADSEGLLSSTLATLPLEARRKAAAVLLPLVVAQAGKEGVSENQKASIGTSALWLGGWKEAASLVAGLKQPPFLVEAPVPAWAMMHASSPLIWPPQAWPWFYETSLRWLPETEKAAFVEAGTLLPASSLRIAWLHAGGDAPRAEQEVKAWIKAEPDSQAAVLAMASLLMQDKKPDEALDLLHRHATRQKDAEQRRMALRLYLQAAFFPVQGPSVSMYNERSRSPLPPPPEKHEKRLRQAATELLPEVRRQTSQWSGAWQSVFQALNLAKDAPTQPARFEASYWTGDQNARDELEDSRNRRRERQSVHSYGIKRLLEAKKKPQAIELMLRQFRRDADQRFSGPAGRMEAGQMEEWRQLITQEGLAAELIKEAAPHQPDDSRRLSQAVHVAEVCGDWAQAVTWAEAVLKLDPDLPWMKLALASARKQLSGDPAVLVAVVRDLPPAQAKAAVLALLQQAQRSADFPHRLAVAQAALDVLSEHPGVLEPETVMRDGVGIQTLSGSAYPPSEVLRQLFELLTQAVQDREGKRVAEGLHPGWSTYRQSSQGDSAKAATPALLDRRKALHAQLCELALKHPEWAETALRPLTGRHLIEGVPSKDELLAYGRKALQALPGRGPSLIQTWTGQGTPADAALRFRLAALVIPLLEEAWRGVQNPYPSQTGLVELIGGKIPPQGQKQWPPLFALWEEPQDIDEGPYVYTPEQLAFNKQRRELMDQLWAAAQKVPALKREVFPAWAAYRLHFIEDATEVIAAAKGIDEARHDLPSLQRFVQLASESYANSHHILTAEVVEALLRPQQADGKKGQPPPGDIVPKTVRLVLLGRDQQRQPMPQLTAPAEEANRVLGESWQKRRMQVLERFEELFGEGTVPMPPELLFSQLEQALLAGKPTNPIEQTLLRQAGGTSGDYEAALKRFILTANGGQAYVPEGNSSGVWDLKRRLLWFETALRLGEPLLEPSRNNSGSSDEWLKEWIDALIEGCEMAAPPVPGVLGLSRHKPAPEQWHQMYKRTPLLAKRDALLLRGLELENSRENSWERHCLEFTLLQLSRGKAGMDRMVAFFDTLAKTKPDQLIGRYLTAWQHHDFRPVADIQLAAGHLLMEALKRAPSIPAESSLNEPFHGWRQMVIDSFNNYLGNEIPLLPDQPWLYWVQNDEFDLQLRQPLARERLDAWKQILEQMAGMPGLAALAFRDLAHLQVETNPSRLLNIARSFTDEEWFRVEQDLESLFRDNHSAAPARRAALGRFACMWEEEAAKRLKRSPEKGKYRRLPDQVLQYLQTIWQPDNKPGFRPPAPTAQELASLSEAASQYAVLLAGDPTGTPEGFSLRARSLFKAGEAPGSVIEITRKLIASQPELASRGLEKWCRTLDEQDPPPAAECAWAGKAMARVAGEWPSSISMDWTVRAISVLGKALTGQTPPPSDHLASLNQLLDAAFAHPNVPQTIVRAVPSNLLEAVNITPRLLTLASKAPKNAGDILSGWWSFRLPYQAPASTNGIAPTLAVLKGWPMKSDPAHLAWTEQFVNSLAPLAAPAERLPTIGGPQESFVVIVPAPSAVPEHRVIQAQVLEELKKRAASLPWMLPLEMRLACASTPDVVTLAEHLKPFFEPPHSAQSLEWIQNALNINLPIHHARLHSMPHSFGQASPLDAVSQQAIDASRILLAAIRGKWLDEAESSALEQSSRRQLNLLVEKGDENAAEARRIPMFGVNGIQPAQTAEAKKLLEDWEDASAPDASTALTPQNLETIVHQMLKTGTEAGIIATRVHALLSAQPKPTARALEEWVLQARLRTDFDAFLRSGRFAARVMESWKGELPVPDWLPLFLETWKPSTKHAWGWTPARDREYRVEAEQVLPSLHTALRRYPACRYGLWFRVMAAYGRKTANLGEAEIAHLTVAHLMAQPRGSVPQPPLPRTFDLNPEFLLGPSFHEEAVLFLFDRLAATQDHDWWSKEGRPALDHALGDAAAVWSRQLQTLAVCPSEDYVRAYHQVMDSASISSYRNGGTYRGTHAVAWALRTASFRKIEVGLETWQAIAASFSADHVVTEAEIWLRVREYSGHDAAKDLRGLLKSYLGEDYGSPAMHAALRAVPRGEKGIWHGYSSKSPSLYGKKKWEDAHRLLGSLARESWGHFRAVLEVSQELGFDHLDGCLAGFITQQTHTSSTAKAVQEWERVLTASKLTSTTPDVLWLAPHDDVVPIWEFARKLELHRLQKPRQWLEEKQRTKPALGTALLLLSRDHLFGRPVPVATIEQMLAPCRREIEKASPAQRAALSAALQVVQPFFTSAVGQADAESVLKLLPGVPARAETPSKQETSSLTWFHSSDEARERLAPLVKEVLDKLVSSQDQQADESAKKNISIMAAEAWQEVLPTGMTRENWLWEQLALVMTDSVRSFPRRPTEEQSQRLDALIRYTTDHFERFELLHGSHRLPQTALYQRLMITGARTPDMEADMLARVLPRDPGPKVLLLLPIFRTLMFSEAVEAQMTRDKPDPWLSWALLARTRPDDPPPPTPDTATWPAVLLLRMADLDASRLTAAQKLAALEFWARSTRALGPHDGESGLSGNGLRWLDDMAPGAGFDSAVVNAAEAMQAWFGSTHAGSWSTASLGSATSLAQSIVKPLLDSLARVKADAQRHQLMQAAAAHSRLAFDELLLELRHSPDAVAACEKWLPVYFHASMDSGRKAWNYAIWELPRFTAKDERIFEAIHQAKLDETCRRTALLLFAMLMDDESTPPKLARSRRLQQALKGLDPNNKAHLPAIDRALRVQGALATALPEWLPVLRRHPLVVSWRKTGKIDWQDLRPSSAEHAFAVSMITLSAAAETLLNNDTAEWLRWADFLNILPQDGKQTGVLRLSKHLVWINLSHLQKHWQSTRPPAEWPRLLLLWDHLPALTGELFPYDYPTALKARIAISKNTPEGRREAVSHLEQLKWTPLSVSEAVVTASDCKLTPAETLNFFASSQMNLGGLRSDLVREAAKTGVMTREHWHAAIPATQPATLAKLAKGLIKWFKEDDDAQGLLLLARQLADLDPALLPPEDWSELAKAAHSDPKLEGRLVKHASPGAPKK